jgi:hypothetical protein
MVQAGTSTSLTCASRPIRLFGRSPAGHPTVTVADAAGAGDRMPAWRCTIGRNMNEPDDKLGVHEELQGADPDPIPDVFPGQDPNVDREWEKAKEDPMGGESPSS